MEQRNDVVAHDVQDDENGRQGYEEDEEHLEHGPEDTGGVGRLRHALDEVVTEGSIRAHLAGPHPGPVCTQTHSPSDAQVGALRCTIVHTCKQQLIIER